jgi:hyperosmotically inducible periplasmic protein
MIYLAKQRKIRRSSRLGSTGGHEPARLVLRSGAHNKGKEGDMIHRNAAFKGALIVLSMLFSQVAFPQEQAEMPDAQQQAIRQMTERVRRAIVTLPQFGVFDHIYFGIKGSTVTLYGRASRPTLRSGAERVVSRIEGVKAVDNQIRVLPVSPNDDRIRAAVYWAIYGFGPLQRYTNNRGGAARLQRNSVFRRAGGITNDPPTGWHAIHIIVENGNVTLVGTVNSSGDLAIAGMRANSVPGVFSVTNDLQVSNE